MNRGSILMSAGQQFKLDIVLKVQSGDLDRPTACEALGVSARTLRRYLKAYSEKGLCFVVHGNKGKSPANKKSDDLKQQMIEVTDELCPGLRPKGNCPQWSP